jgi:sn1-specific diacylglycerol lipase
MLGVVDFDRTVRCVALLWQHILGYLAILSGSLLVEFFISVVAMRGGILETEVRAPMKYLLYIRLGKYYRVFLFEAAFWRRRPERP